jgi:hypothetical protein
MKYTIRCIAALAIFFNDYFNPGMSLFQVHLSKECQAHRGVAINYTTITQGGAFITGKKLVTQLFCIRKDVT